MASRVQSNRLMMHITFFIDVYVLYFADVILLCCNFFILDVFLNECVRYVRRADEADAFDFHHYSLLSCHSCHSAFHSLKLSLDNSDHIAALIVAVLWLHQFDVAIVYACHLDEVHHLVVWYGERRVLTIFICGEVVIIIGEKVQFGSILDAMIYDLRTYVDKEKAWKIRLKNLKIL